MKSIDVEKIKREFPIFKADIDGSPLIYFDSAATALKPRQVIAAVNEYYTKFTANVHRGKHMLSELASDRFEFCRHRVAELVGSSSDEVVFVRNTTEGINLAADIIRLEPEDLIVGFLDSHHSQILPWMSRANLELVRHTSDWGPDLDQYESLLKRRPKVVAVTHCSNVTGVYPPVDIIVEMAKKHGALVVLDAAQSVSHSPINFREMGVDFLAFSSHKMFGPSGIGCLIGKSSLLNASRPLLYGGGMVDYVSVSGLKLRKSPHRFESGTPSIEGAFGLAEAVNYIESISFPAIEKYLASITRSFLEEIAMRDYIQLIGPGQANGRAPIFSFTLSGIKDLAEITKILSDSYGIMCRSGHLCSQPLIDSRVEGEVMRASAHIYNSIEDVRKLMSVLDQVTELYSPR